MTAPLSERMRRFIESLQDEICSALEAQDATVKFREDLWQRPGGGGGRTRVLEGGQVFEKAGVNISAVHGELEEAFAKGAVTAAHVHEVIVAGSPVREAVQNGAVDAEALTVFEVGALVIAESLPPAASRAESLLIASERTPNCVLPQSRASTILRHAARGERFREEWG